MAHEYDIIIVGGGLGGAALGKSLAKNGVSDKLTGREKPRCVFSLLWFYEKR
jgi:2-polyprenyl-6-methoxyphenol hydroxylase-like FAD-dependent oxidoreductase